MSTKRYSMVSYLKRIVRTAMPVLGAGLLGNIALAQVPDLPLTPPAPNVQAPNVPAPGVKTPDVKLPGEVTPPGTPAVPSTPAVPITPTVPRTPAAPKQDDPSILPPAPSTDANKPQPNNKSSDNKSNDPALNIDPLNRKAVDVNVQSDTTIKGNVNAQGRTGATVNGSSGSELRGQTLVNPNLGGIDVRSRTGANANINQNPRGTVVDPNLRGNVTVPAGSFNYPSRGLSGYNYDSRGNYFSDGRGNYYYDGRWTNVAPSQRSTMAPQSATVVQRGRLGVTIVSQDGHLFVNEVFQGTPAAQAGLQPNDELVAINGQRIRSYDELLALLDNSSRSNGQALIDFQRNGRIERASVDLAASASYPAYSGRTETYFRGPYQNNRSPNNDYNYNNGRNYDGGWNKFIPGRRDSRGPANRGRW